MIGLLLWLGASCWLHEWWGIYRKANCKDIHCCTVKFRARYGWLGLFTEQSGWMYAFLLLKGVQTKKTLWTLSMACAQVLNSLLAWKFRSQNWWMQSHDKHCRDVLVHTALCVGFLPTEARTSQLADLPCCWALHQGCGQRGSVGFPHDWDTDPAWLQPWQDYPSALGCAASPLSSMAVEAWLELARDSAGQEVEACLGAERLLATV